MAEPTSLARKLRGNVHSLSGSSDDFDGLLELVGDARFVLIGEASHGTHEFYRLRALLTRRLILEKGYNAVAAEADWPDAYRVNRYVRCVTADSDAVDALAGFRRFPAWMWRNADVLDFVGWLRSHNEARNASHRVGFYGLDLYSLHASIEEVLTYLDKTDPEMAARVRSGYSCFDQYGDDPEDYAYATGYGLNSDCEDKVVKALMDLQRRRESMLRNDGFAAEDEYFCAEQNARVVKNAEQYYRTMFRGRVSSWNLRDTHMVDTLDALAQHLGERTQEPKIIVWAHNSHVGDARATQLGGQGEVTLGQLTRERHPDETTLIGFSTFIGTVTAASDWGGVAERKHVRPALAGSYEELFHQVGIPNFWTRTADLPHEGTSPSATRMLERAIGVIYRPQSERSSHYFYARLAEQFDALIHLDRTRALEPLERGAKWEHGEAPETFPSGL